MVKLIFRCKINTMILDVHCLYLAQILNQAKVFKSKIVISSLFDKLQALSMLFIYSLVFDRSIYIVE